MEARAEPHACAILSRTSQRAGGKLSRDMPRAHAEYRMLDRRWEKMVEVGLAEGPWSLTDHGRRAEMKLKSNLYDLEAWSILIREAQVTNQASKYLRLSFTCICSIYFLYFFPGCSITLMMVHPTEEDFLGYFDGGFGVKLAFNIG